MTPLTFSNLRDFPHGCFPRPRNVAYEFGEIEAEVNRATMLIALKDQAWKGLISAQQTHNDHIFVLRKGDPIPTQEIPDTDAFISDVPGVALMVKTADCQPILMGVKGGPVAAVHSGWKGSLKNIIGKTVAKMVETFGVDPSDIFVGIGPSLGPCCAEFSDPQQELNEAALAHLIPGTKRIDFWELTRGQLNDAGIPNRNLQFSNICTVCEKDKWFSYRGDNPDMGRFGSVIGIY